MAVHWTRIGVDKVLAIAGVNVSRPGQHDGYMRRFLNAISRIGSPQGRGYLNCKSCGCKVRSVGHESGSQHTERVRAVKKDRSSRV